MIVPLGLIAVVLAWLFFKLRSGSGRVSYIVGRVAAFGILGLGLVGGPSLGVVVLTVRGATTPRTWRRRWTPSSPSYRTALAWLLGREWFQGSLYLWLLVVAVVMLASLVLGWLFALLRGGVRYATRTVDDALAGLVADSAQISPRRVWALSWLAVRRVDSPARVIVCLGGLRDVVALCGLVHRPGQSESRPGCTWTWC